MKQEYIIVIMACLTVGIIYVVRSCIERLLKILNKENKITLEIFNIFYDLLCVVFSFISAKIFLMNYPDSYNYFFLSFFFIGVSLIIYHYFFKRIKKAVDNKIKRWGEGGKDVENTMFF